tara:strand:- start:1914 stop:2438 length:525 start_codon:yes stop_codon:yes gene_type:complete
MNTLIEAVLGDITKLKTEVIVNAANGVGIMGRGLAGSIAEHGGPLISGEARELVNKREKPFEPGDVYITGPGLFNKRGVKNIYHAVIMMYPGGFTSVDTINVLIRKTLGMAIENDIKSIAIPSLGSGLGRLSKSVEANVMLQAARKFDHLINIKIIDSDPDFISEIEKLIGEPL